MKLTKIKNRRYLLVKLNATSKLVDCRDRIKTQPLTMVKKLI